MSDKQLMGQLATLKESLRTADIAISGSLSEVFNAFFDLADGPDLMRSCKRADSDVIRAALERLVRRVEDDETLRLEQLRMLAHKPTGFFHGGFLAAGAMGTFFYFLKEGMGLLALNKGTPMTHYFRMTTTELPPGTLPVRGPPGTQ